MLLPDDRRPKHLLLQPTKFCPYSLGDWIRLCETTGIPHLTATHVVDFERWDMLNHEYAGPHQQRLDAAYDAVRRAKAPGSMMRWDCCASAHLKVAMAEGRPPDDGDELQRLPLDARVLEIAYEHPRVLIPVWRRPWIASQMLFAGGYPVEYRAFVENGRLLGISSYYPQRPLPPNDRHLYAIEDQIRALLARLSGPFEWPATEAEKIRARAMIARLDGKEPSPGAPAPDGVHFTADFVAISNGILLLEGGPPHCMGAHPCCFPAGRIRGVALRAADTAANSEEPPEGGTETQRAGTTSVA